MIIAQAETAALVLIALLAEGITQDGGDVAVEVASLTVSLEYSQTAILAAAFVLVAVGLTMVYGSIGATRVAAIEAEARESVAANFAQADWEYQSRQKASRVEGRIRLAESPGLVFSGFLEYARAASAVLVFVSAAFLISTVAALLMVAMGLLFSVVVLPLRRRARTLAATSARQKVRITDELMDGVDQGASAQAFGAWPTFLNRFVERSRRLAVVRRREFVIRTRLPMAYQNGALLLLVAVLYLAPRPDSSEAGLAAFAAPALLLLRSVQYGQMLQSALHKLAMNVPLVERLQHDSSVPPPRFSPGPETLRGIESLELRGVSYRYPDEPVAAIRDISLTMRSGRIVGVAGHSGGGKSTLGQVLLRLRWPTSGGYFVNGKDARGFSNESWTSGVAYLPQSPRLLHASLLDNVKFFDERIADKDALAALRSVGLQDLVEQLPNGVDTLLGPTGHALSGGQVQRLGIARVLARKPYMVVLDEPTSALDADSESLVATALQSFARRSGTMVVIVAHRPSTLLLCDDVLMLSEGRQVACGALADVRSSNPLLARILSEGSVDAFDALEPSVIAD